MDTPALLAMAKVEVLQAGPDLLAELHARVSSFLMMFEQPRQDVLAAIVEVLQTRGVQSVVIEKEYVDADFLQTHAQHYSKAFRPKSPMCQRLHFFGSRVEPSELLSLSEAQKAAYLGYCVLRPTGHQFIGRTVIAPPRMVPDGAGLVHTSANFSAHLLGQHLEVNGTPFIQQDVNTFICAGAALWVVGMVLHKTIGTARYYPGEITETALTRFSEAQLRKGLTASQIVMTLREMGLNPHVEAFANLQQLRADNPDGHAAVLSRVLDFIAVFVDSGIPPILAYSKGAEGHAVVVAGHDVWELPQPPSPISGHVGSWVFVQNLFVMDDARGPYRVVESEATHADSVALDTVDSIAIIAPVPPEVVADPGDASKDGLRLLNFWNELLHRHSKSLNLPDLTNLCVVPGAGGPPVIRRVLMDSRQWKQCVISSAMPQWLRACYQAMHLPKYIWVLELSDWANFSKAKHADRRLFGEVLLDATANPQCPYDNLISFHANGLLYLDSTDSTTPQYLGGPEPLTHYPPVCNPHGR